MLSKSLTQTFTPYPWQGNEWETFSNLLDTGKLPHAVLISGPGEIGKRQFAMALAARLFCQSLLDGRPCLQCKGCTLLAGGSHPDFFLLELADKGKSISVDSIRELAEFTTKTPMLRGWRVALIDPAEAMTHNAANALLKTLEEPGRDTLLILVHQQRAELLPTIRSRCQSFLFPVPGQALTIEWLQSNVEVEDYVDLLEKACWRPLRAVRIAGDGALDQIIQIEKVLADVAAGLLSPVLAAEQCKTIPPAELLESVLVQQSNVIAAIVKENGTPSRGHFLFLDQLIVARRQLASKTNPNPQLLIEELLFGWRRLQSQLQSRPQSRPG